MSNDPNWTNIERDIELARSDEEFRVILKTIISHLKTTEIQIGLLAHPTDGKKPNPWQFGPHTLPDFKGSSKSFGNTEVDPK